MTLKTRAPHASIKVRLHAPEVAAAGLNESLTLPALLPLLIGLGLRDALLLQLVPVLQDRVQLGLGPGEVLLRLTDHLLQRRLLLVLVLHVLLLCGLCDLVLLGGLVVLLLGLLLRRFRLRQVLREVTL